MTPKIYVSKVEAMDGWSHVKSEPCSTLTFTHDISYIASIFFTFKNLCELNAHKNYVTGEIHSSSVYKIQKILTVR